MDYSGVIAASISRASASSGTTRLNASYTITPESAAKGQTVTLAYTLHNAGTTDIVDVVITSPNLGARDRVNVARIAAGERITVNYQYTMGTRSATFRPRITYRADGGRSTQTINNVGNKTVTFQRGAVTANLSTRNRTTVEPGTQLDLTLNLTNSSSVTYTDVKITSELLGEIETGITLRANNGRHSATKTITVDESREYSFRVTGKGSDGKELDITSNLIRVTALDMSKQLQFAIEATTDTLEIYEEPALIDFIITVRNTGQATGTDLFLMHGRTQLHNIGTMNPGEERMFAKRLLVSMHGEFGFSVTGNNAQGMSQTITQNEEERVKVAYAEPTPIPVTPPPATKPPVQEATEPPIVGATTGDSDGGDNMTILWVLAGVLLTALAAVMGVSAVSRRRQARDEAKGDSAIDTIQRTPVRDYTSKHKPIQGTQRMRPVTPESVDADMEDMEFEVGHERLKAGLAPERGMGSLAAGMSMSQLAATYGRPEEEEAPKARKRPRADDAAPARTAEEATNAYLSRMREPAEGAESAEAGDYTRRRRARSAGA